MERIGSTRFASSIASHISNHISIEKTRLCGDELMEAKYINHSGSDLSIAQAAWVSTNRQGVESEVKRLLTHLAKHKHWTPFAHPTISFECTAPIFVARQLNRHQIGLVWSEESRRYVFSSPDYYVPVWRLKSSTLKQGSGEDMPQEDQRMLNEIYNDAVHNSIKQYEKLLMLGVAPEQARMILPASIMTRWVWTGTLFAWHRVYELRSKHSSGPAQSETVVLTDQIGSKCAELFPIAWEALNVSN
jgi:thymidylate synthase (FAD)